MKKYVSLLLCAVLALTLLAGCQGEPDVPYVSGEQLQGGQQIGDQTDPAVPGTTGAPQQTVPGQTTPNHTDPEQPAGTTDGTEGFWPEDDDPPASQPTQPPTDPADFVLPTPDQCTYAQYQAMTGDQQEAFFAQFKDDKGEADFVAFFAWLDKAKAEHEANSDDIVLDPDATIDWDEIFNKDE